MLEHFELDERLQQDCIFICDLPLSSLLLSKDANYPWFILVPRVANATEYLDLMPEQIRQFWMESEWLSEMIMSLFSPDKLNIAALGNVVEQLHVHHIGRFHHDIAWPNPVWGFAPAKPYADDHIQALKHRLDDYIESNPL